MTKKIVAIGALVVALWGMGFAPLSTLAQSEKLESPEFMFQLGGTGQQSTGIVYKGIDEQSWIRKGINFVFERIIGIMAATVGSAAVLVMAVGGFMMLASAGNQEQYDKGKGLIMKAVVGLVFVLGAYFVVTTVQILVKSITEATQ